MKTKKLELLSPITKASDNKNGGLKIAGYANTVTKDRQGDVIVASAWKKGVSNYQNNPILLWQHNPNQPIGKVTKLSVDKKGLMVEADISRAAEEQYKLHSLIKDGVLKSFSVGFRVLDQKYDSGNDSSTITDLELLEISVVSIPANQDSLFSIAKQFDTDAEYKEFVAQFKDKSSSDKQALYAGCTTMSGDHYHTFEIDAKGNGRTTFTSHGVAPHSHNITDRKIVDRNEHEHDIKFLDIVEGEKAEPESIGEKEVIFEDKSEDKQMTEKSDTPSEEEQEVVLMSEKDITPSSDEDTDNKTVENCKERFTQDVGFEGYKHLLSDEVSKLENGVFVKLDGKRWVIKKIATKESPVFNLTRVDINGNERKEHASHQASELEVVNGWDIGTDFDIELLKHDSDIELTEDSRNKIAKEFDELVNMSEMELFALKSNKQVQETKSYQNKLNKTLNLVSIDKKDWTDTNYIVAKNICDLIKYIKADNPDVAEEYEFVLTLHGHNKDVAEEISQERGDKMADHQVGDPIVLNTGAKNNSEEATPEKSQATSSTQVSEPKVSELVEKTGSKVEEIERKESSGENIEKQLEEFRALKSELQQYKDDVRALTESKMQFAAQARNDNPYSKEEMADAYLLCKAFQARNTYYGEVKESIFDHSGLGQKIKAVTTVDSFISNFSTTLHQELEQQLIIAPLLRRISVDAQKFRVPVADEDTDGDVAQFANGNYVTGAYDTTNVPVSNQHVIKAVEFTPHKFMATTHIAKDEEEDTILPLLPFLRDATVRRMARAIDKAILRGDGTISSIVTQPTNAISAGGAYQSAIEGLVTLADNAGPTALRVNTGSDTAATPTDIASARAKLGKYGLRVGTDNLVYLTTIEGYNELVQTADFRTVDTFGPQATYHTGTVGAIYGIPVMVTEFLDNKGSSGNLIGALVYRQGFLVAERRAMEVESEYNPRQQVTAVYFSTRFDMKPLTTNTTYKLDSSYPMACVLESGA